MVLQGKEEVLLFQRQIPASRVLKAIGVVVGSGLVVVIVTMLVAFSNSRIELH